MDTNAAPKIRKHTGQSDTYIVSIPFVGEFGEGSTDIGQVRKIRERTALFSGNASYSYGASIATRWTNGNKYGLTFRTRTQAVADLVADHARKAR